MYCLRDAFYVFLSLSTENVDAAGGRSLDCIVLLLKYGRSGNVPGEAGLLPIHKVACERHYLRV